MRLPQEQLASGTPRAAMSGSMSSDCSAELREAAARAESGFAELESMCQGCAAMCISSASVLQLLSQEQL